MGSVLKMFLFVGFVYAIVYCYKNRLKIDFVSFFKKGFKLNRDKYGTYCFTGKQGSR